MNKCGWTMEPDPDYEHGLFLSVGRWETSCDNAFQFTVDGPEENNFKFCPYCGGELEIVVTE